MEFVVQKVSDRRRESRRWRGRAFAAVLAVLALPAGVRAEDGRDRAAPFSGVEELANRFTQRTSSNPVPSTGFAETEILRLLDLDTWPANPWGGKWRYVQTPYPYSLTFLSRDLSGRLRAHYHTDFYLLGRRPTLYDDFNLEPAIGEARGDFLWTPPWENNALGRLVADALREQAKADVGIVNALGLRGNIPAGRITDQHIPHVLPFNNEVYRMEMPAGRVASLLLESMWDGRQFQLGSRALHFSGVTLEYWPDPESPFELEGELARSDGRILSKTDTLLVAFASYIVDSMAFRSLELDSLKDVWANDTDASPLFTKKSVGYMRPAFRSYITAHSPLSPDMIPNLVELPEDSVAARVRSDLEAALAVWKRRKTADRPGSIEISCEDIRTETGIWIPHRWLRSGVRPAQDGNNLWIATVSGLGLIEEGKRFSIFRLPTPAINDLEMKPDGLWITSWAPLEGPFDGEDIIDLPPEDFHWRDRRALKLKKVVHVFDVRQRKITRTFTPEPPRREKDAGEGDESYGSIKDVRRSIEEELRIIYGSRKVRSRKTVEDPYEASVWVATRDGFFVYDKEHGRLTDLRSVFTTWNLGEPRVQWILCAKKYVWVVAKPGGKDIRGGLLRLDRQTRQWNVYRKEVTDGRAPPIRRGREELPGGEPVKVDIQTIVVCDDYVWVTAVADNLGKIPYVAEFDVAAQEWTRYIGERIEEPLLRMARLWHKGVRREGRMQDVQDLLSRLTAIPNARLIPVSPGPDTLFTYDSGVWKERPEGGIVQVGSLPNPVLYEGIVAVRGGHILVRTNTGLEMIDVSNWKRRRVIDPAGINSADVDWRIFQVNGDLVFCEDNDRMSWESSDEAVSQRMAVLDWSSGRLVEISTLTAAPFKYIEKIYHEPSAAAVSGRDRAFELDDGRRAVLRLDGLWIEGR